MNRQLLQKANQEARSEANSILQVKRFRASQIIFIALFTSVLAMFVIMIAMVGIEPNQEKLSYQKIINRLYHDISQQAKKDGMNWLVINNTVTKGVKLTMNPSIFQKNSLFAPARAKINPLYLPYLNQFVVILKAIGLKDYIANHERLARGIPLAPNQKLVMTIRVEGHTDATPLAKTALYQSNIELSGFRAYAIMHYIHLYSQLPGNRFGIAGYGSLRPISKNPMDAINRRVEIYIIPEIITQPEAVS